MSENHERVRGIEIAEKASITVEGRKVEVVADEAVMSGLRAKGSESAKTHLEKVAQSAIGNLTLLKIDPERVTRVIIASRAPEGSKEVMQTNRAVLEEISPGSTPEKQWHCFDDWGCQCCWCVLV